MEITQAQIDAMIEAVVAEIARQSATPLPALSESAGRQSFPELDLPDITTREARSATFIRAPSNPQVLRSLRGTTPARIGIGRAGPRYRTVPQLIFWADHAITQDALYQEIEPALLAELDLFQVQTRVRDREEYLLRPDLGRRLSDPARDEIQNRCLKKPDVQLYVNDGLSATAIEHNLRDILPIIRQGLEQSGLKIGTPFYVRYGRVGLMNEINSIIDAQVVVVLIGERPGLGRAESMSAYMGYRPRLDSTDADRDVVCNIFEGGTNPLEAGAYIVEFIKKMIHHQASGVKLKLMSTETTGR